MSGNNLREVRLRWLAPVLVLFSLLINYSIANASLLRLDSFAPVAVLAERVANYGKDPFSLAFPPANQQLASIVLGERRQSEETAEESEATTTATPTPIQTATSETDSSTLPLISTVDSLIPTLASILPTPEPTPTSCVTILLLTVC